MFRLLPCKVAILSMIWTSMTASECHAQTEQHSNSCRLSKEDYSETGTRADPAGTTIESNEPVRFEVREILDEWEKVSSRIERMEGNFFLREFNHTFEVEHISEGRFVLEGPEVGCITTRAVTPSVRNVSGRRNKQGTAYSLQEGQSFGCVIEADSITMTDLNGRGESTIVSFASDEHLLQDFREEVLFLNRLIFGMKADEATRRFQWSILKDNDDGVILLAVPLNKYGRSNRSKFVENDDPIPMADGPVPHNFWVAFFESIWARNSLSEATVRLDKKTWFPTHIRLQSPGGAQREYLYRIEYSVVTEKLQSNSPGISD